MKNRILGLNWILFLATLSLVALGTVAIWSAGGARAESYFHGMWKTNLATAVFGLALGLLLAFTDYRRLLTLSALPGYFAAVAMLVAVLVFGSERFGGRRWLWFFQPSEISKLLVISLLAWLYGSEHDPDSPFARWSRGFRGFCLGGVLLALPLLLILAEPDLGTALTLVPAALLMLYVADVWRTGLVTLFATGLVTALAILGAVAEAERPGTSPERREAILRYVPLRRHQLERVVTFLHPERSPDDAGYNLRQAKIAIGSGGLTGKGFGKGETNHLKYLPQKVSMNDFIFCVWAEETGYIGSLVLLSLFAALLLSGVWIAYRAVDGRGRLLAIGVTTLVFDHVFINIAMSIGLVPITGLPLPFVSSGRTFLLTVLIGLGLVQSVSVHRTIEEEP